MAWCSQPHVIHGAYLNIIYILRTWFIFSLLLLCQSCPFLSQEELFLFHFSVWVTCHCKGLWTIFLWADSHTYIHSWVFGIVSRELRAPWAKPPGHVPLPSTGCIEAPVKPWQIRASTGDSTQLSWCGWTPPHQGWASAVSRTFPPRSGKFGTFPGLIKACGVSISVFHRGQIRVSKVRLLLYLGYRQKSGACVTLHGRCLDHLGYNQ